MLHYLHYLHTIYTISTLHYTIYTIYTLSTLYLHYTTLNYTIYTSPADLTLYLGVHRFAFYGVSETAIKVEIRGSSTYGLKEDLKQMIYWPGWCVRDLCPPQLGRHRRHLLQLRRGPAHPGHRGGHVSYR